MGRMAHYRLHFDQAPRMRGLSRPNEFSLKVLKHHPGGILVEFTVIGQEALL